MQPALELSATMDAKEPAARAGVVSVPKTRQQTLLLLFDLPFFLFYQRQDFPMSVITLPAKPPVASKRKVAAHRSLRERLCKATAYMHTRVEVQFAQLDLRRREDYRHFLEMQAAALLPLEAALVAADVARLFPDWERRSRRCAIVEDLAALGGVIHTLAPPRRLDLAGVLGGMYVLESSRLGAKALLAEVAQSPDPIVVRATAFLRHGASLSLWRSFLSQLEGHAAALDDPERAMRAACIAFDLFSQAASVPAAA
jgi:heme oxygenase (biliverdin-IX-beta and delta-forming)